MVEDSNEEQTSDVSPAESEDSPAKVLTIPHKLSKQFTSHFATGVILSGPLPDGFFQMVFYTDAIGIESERASLKEHDDTGALYEVKSDVETARFREDKVRISMPEAPLRSLYGLLKRRFESLDDSADESKS